MEDLKVRLSSSPGMKDGHQMGRCGFKPFLPQMRSSVRSASSRASVRPSIDS